jgi:hypothetical protein
MIFFKGLDVSGAVLIDEFMGEGPAPGSLSRPINERRILQTMQRFGYEFMTLVPKGMARGAI